VIVLAAAAAYLVGAVPIGFVVARLFGVSDIRRHGSGNIGATNVLRTAGWLPALVTLFADITKGYVAVLLAERLADGFTEAAAVGAVAAVVGNALLRLAPLATLAAVPVFLAVVLTTRFISLGSLLGAACVPFGVLVLGPSRAAAAGAFVVAAIIFFRHSQNIARLRAGTESRLGQRAAPAGGARP
jgi:acyl phosphate:glycerol-3-phosphate acyltransferase